MKLKDTSIKSLPLGVGLAISIILVAKICFELSYDRCYRDSQNIYQIRTGFNQQGHELDYSGVSGGCGRVACGGCSADSRFPEYHRRPGWSAGKSIVRATDPHYSCSCRGNSVRGGSPDSCAPVFEHPDCLRHTQLSGKQEALETCPAFRADSCMYFADEPCHCHWSPIQEGN